MYKTIPVNEPKIISSIILAKIQITQTKNKAIDRPNCGRPFKNTPHKREKRYGTTEAWISPRKEREGEEKFN